MKYDLVTIADLCIDILFVGDVTPEYGQVEQFVADYHVELGGSATIFASQFAKMGGNPAFFGVIGNDIFGAMLSEKLKSNGVSTEFLTTDTQFKTAVGLGLAKGDDRAMLTYKGTMSDVTPELVLKSGILGSAKHLHIASFYLMDQLNPLWQSELPKLKALGHTVSLDTNWCPDGSWEKVHSILDHVDVFIPNEEEALHISGKATCDEAGQWLNEKVKLVVIKRGADGARVYQNGTIVNHEVPDELKANLVIADTTGAGDNFASGFVYAWLKGKELAEAVTLGMRCATGSLAYIGGIQGQLRS
jgi:sugar/nucleoside kinase (ribokinase family)